MKQTYEIPTNVDNILELFNRFNGETQVAKIEERSRGYLGTGPAFYDIVARGLDSWTVSQRSRPCHGGLSKDNGVNLFLDIPLLCKIESSKAPVVQAVCKISSKLGTGLDRYEDIVSLWTDHLAWLKNDSFLKDVFIKKSGPLKADLINVNCAGNVVLLALGLQRQMAENPRFLIKYKAALDHGASRETAIFFALTGPELAMAGGTPYVSLHYRATSDHNPLNICLITKHDVKLFLKGEISKDRVCVPLNRGRYHSVQRLFGSSDWNFQLAKKRFLLTMYKKHVNDILGPAVEIGEGWHSANGQPCTAESYNEVVKRIVNDLEEVKGA